MTKRSDIPSRLIYTCNCGWVDKGHANSSSNRPYVGAHSLWQQIQDATGTKTKWPFAGYQVIYQQDMSANVLGARVGVAHRGKFLVREGLTRMQKESVALAIFLEVSYSFEAMQWWTGAPRSSFSEEDLISNLLGFYKVVRPNLDIMALCRPVSTKASQKVWDDNGGLGKSKELQPVFHKCKECLETPKFPVQLRGIAPAPKGQAGGNLWRDWQGRGFGG